MELGGDQVAHLFGLEQQLVGARRRVRVGQAQREAVIAVDLSHFLPEALLEPRFERQGPGGVDLAAEWRQHADPPVTELVPEPLDNHCPVIRDGRRLGLVVEVGEQVARRPLVETGALDQPLLGLLGGRGADFPEKPAQRLPELDGAILRVALPERQLARLARRRRDQHLRGGDVGHAPGRGPEDEVFARPRLVDHLLVELADPAAVLQEVHRVEPAVGDGAAARHRQPLRPGPPPHRAVDAVPDDPRPQLGELIRGVATAQHVQHRVERTPSEIPKGVGAADERGQLVDRPFV